jgi:hypothetical protein
MNDTQLREELSTFGVNVGPINDSTRETYTRLLAKKKGGGSPSRSSSRKSYSPARTATPKTKTPPTRRNVSPPPVERPVPISPPRRTPPSTRRASPPSTRRESPPAITRQPPPSVSPPRPVRQVSPTRVSPPKPIRQPPPQPKRVSPRPFHQSSTSQYSRPADPVTPDYPLSRSTAAYNRIDFDNSVPDEDDDDHMEFSKYIPRSNYSKRPQNTSLSSSFLDNTKKKVATAVRTSKGFQINPTFCVGGALMCLVLGYILTPQTFHSGVTTTSDLFNSVIMVGFKYAIAPILAVGFLFALGCALYYGFQALSKNRAIHEEKKRKLIKDILKAVCNAPTHGIPVKQLRDRMVPAYKRTKDELLLWNECEDFVKTYETRVRAEERANHNGDEIVEHFVWVGSTLNQDLEDE